MFNWRLKEAFPKQISTFLPYLINMEKKEHKYFLPFLDVPLFSHSSPLFALAVPNGQTLGTAIACSSLSNSLILGT